MKVISKTQKIDAGSPRDRYNYRSLFDSLESSKAHSKEKLRISLENRSLKSQANQQLPLSSNRNQIKQI